MKTTIARERKTARRQSFFYKYSYIFFELLFRVYASCKASSYFSSIIFCTYSLVSELMGCAISRYSPVADLRLGIATNTPFSPSITLISRTTNSLSSVIETIALILPSSATLRTLTSVISIPVLPFRPLHAFVQLIFYSSFINI